MFDDADALIQIDMSEYMEKFTVSRLVGSPPGYVGYEEGGQLTEKVRRRPYSVVLFDEVEKAHPDVMHMLLQILEEGKLTDSLGRTVDFRNTVVILTSNLGAGFLKQGAGLGFGGTTDEAVYEQLKTQMLEEAKRVFKPELLNRIDDMIVFRPLNREDLVSILDLEMGKIAARIGKSRGVELRLSQAAKDFLIDKGYNPEYGARPMRRAVERHLEDPLAEAVLGGQVGEAGVVEVDVEEDRLRFRQLAGAESPGTP